MEGADRAIAELAGGQHGVVGRHQLLALGLKPGAIGRRLRAGRLHRIHPGVYAVGHPLLTPQGHFSAAVLARSPGATLSHWSAAAHWGLRRTFGSPVHITLARPTTSSQRIRCHRAFLPEDERTEHHDIPVTTVPRTIFDLAAVAPAELVEAAFKEAEYLRLYDPLALPDLLERYPHHRGVSAIRVCLERHGASSRPPGPSDERVRSRLEERFLPFVDRHRLPRPRFNAWLEVKGRWHQVDCLWPGQRQIIELDGWEGHGTRRAFREDRARDRRLRVAGYGITRLTWSQLDDEPEKIAADLRRLLQRNGAEKS